MTKSLMPIVSNTFDALPLSGLLPAVRLRSVIVTPFISYSNCRQAPAFDAAPSTWKIILENFRNFKASAIVNDNPVE